MKWTQFTVIIFLAIQQVCAVQEQVGSPLKIEGGEVSEVDLVLKLNPHQQLLNIPPSTNGKEEPKEYLGSYTTLHDHHTPLSDMKMVKVARVKGIRDDDDDQGRFLEKRGNQFPVPTKPAVAPDVVPAGNTIYPGKHITHPTGGGGGSSIAHSAESAAHSATSAAAKTKKFGGKAGKAVAGVALATAVVGGIAGIAAIKNHQQKGKYMKRQEEESFQALEKRNKIPKGKAAAFFAGGAAVGAAGLHFYRGSSSPPAAEPNAASSTPPPAK
ncbi:uncharacterized protein FA14DRAFT_182291 [Meira miltonrushii]|uniref:Uncharacterized protein n=1 Tax=Meira miltonrushii TaxID=1280837 RepID=A0A316V548_9BASI|nr:uncharacterized protein FA14DRAFT_182291 [Meira miltonrushii]PWN32384.1 hypothetical protein FA14DRAFT_182291 [Meira miltonrushii]